MKRIIAMLLTLALAGVSLAASCDSGGDGDGAGKTACEKEDEIIAGAGRDYCKSRDEECCMCRCINQGKRYDSTEFFDNENCVCEELDTSGEVDDAGVEICEGTELSAAEECLADEEACAAPYRLNAESGCKMTPL